MTIKPLFSSQPWLSGHLPVPQGWPLNRGSNVQSNLSLGTPLQFCIIQTPLCYRQFVWSQKCQKSLHTFPTSIKFRHLCKAGTWLCPFGVCIKEFWLYLFTCRQINSRSLKKTRLCMYFSLTLRLLLIREIMLRHIDSRINVQLKFNTIAAPRAKGSPP